VILSQLCMIRYLLITPGVVINNSASLSNSLSSLSELTPLLILGGLLARRVLQELRVTLVRRQLYVTHDAAADEAVLDAHHVRVLVLVRDADVRQLDVEELIDRVQSATDAEVIL